MKSRVFIASASNDDRMNIARAVANSLADYEVNTDLWPHIFPLGKNTLDSLLIETRKADFAICVLGPDDLVQKSKLDDPKGHYYVPRDNVIFELGLFIKALGKDRCFALLPKNHPDLHLFTDFMGQNYATYESTKAPGTNESDAVATAFAKIGKTVQAKGAMKKNKFRMFFKPKDTEKPSQAVVIYPHITSDAGKIKFQIHYSSANDDYQSACSASGEELAHFDDLRAVSEIVELCTRMGVRVAVTRDGQEQDMIEGPDKISFLIGTLNGYTVQALKMIEDATNGHFTPTLEFFKKVEKDADGKSYQDITLKDREVTFKLDGKKYPPDEPTDENEPTDEKSRDLNYAILVRTFHEGSPWFVCVVARHPERSQRVIISTITGRISFGITNFVRWISMSTVLQLFCVSGARRSCPRIVGLKNCASSIIKSIGSPNFTFSIMKALRRKSRRTHMSAPIFLVA